ncbi:MAG: DEAD/DEAH box helicase [Bdellovibrionaceae bacterium]|nr:DEAD/DEAH box helicase [Pseudobdellovibrionaceae bacterium]
MKLKPVIKPHWLASQNPMDADLLGLRRVVFTPPPSVLNTEFTKDPKARVDLAPPSLAQIVPIHDEESREVRIRSHSYSRELYWTLFSGHDLSSYKVHPTALSHLASSLEFHFEDGWVYSLVGIDRLQGIPHFLSPRYYLLDKSPNWARVLEGHLADDYMAPLKVLEYQKRQDEFRKTWFTVLEILAWAFQRQRQVGDLEVLWAEPGEARAGYPLRDLEFLRARPVAVTVRADEESDNAARITMWEGLAKERTAGVLRLHAVGTFGDWQSAGASTITPSAEEVETLGREAKGDWDWEPRFVNKESNPKDIAKTLERLKQTVGDERLHFVHRTGVSGANFKPVLRLREDEGTLHMAVRFDVALMNAQHVNFPASVQALLAPFLGGLDRFFNVDRKTAASNKVQFRTNDLLFLRHQGLTIFCLLELLNWRLGRPLTSGETIPYPEDPDAPEMDWQFERLAKYLKMSIPGLLGKPGAVFEDLLSGEARGYFTDFLEKMHQHLKDDHGLMFHGGLVGEIRGVQKQVLPLLRFLILHFVESTHGKILTRAQAPVGDNFKAAITPWTSPRAAVLASTAPNDEPLWVDVGLFSKSIVPMLFDLLDHGIEVEFNGAPFLNQDNPFEFIFSVQDSEQKEDSNWFDLHPQIFFNGKRISSEDVHFNFTPDQVGFIEYRGQMYRIDKKQIPTLKSLQRFWNRIRGDKEKIKRDSFGDRVYRIEKSQALELLMLRAQGVQVEGDGEWRRIYEYFDRGLGTDKIQLPEEMQTRLLPHQLEGAQWLHDLHELGLGAILADDMGLGKTFQVLAFLTSLQRRGKLKRSLIIVPTSLVYNWVDEKKKFAPDLPVKVFHSGEQAEMREALRVDPSTVVLATYGLLSENVEFFESFEWNTVIFDEAQNLKNIMSVRSVSARKLKASFKACLTGTPMENHYLEFYSLCDLVVPGSLGDVDSFRKRYYNNEVRPEALRDLRLISKPLVLRRTKAQVKLSLPEKTVQKVLLPFGPQQRDIYKKMAMTFSRQVEDLIQSQGERKAQIAMFSALMRLRQICSDPAAIPGVQYDEKPVKVEHFLESLQEHFENGESVIVFTQFLSTLGRIESELKKQNVPAFVLQGRISAKERLRLIDEFQKHDGPAVMLMTLKTGGVGLNLTKASVVYHLEPWWNPAVENQATDRAHRMGQTKNVKVYNLLIEGSLEERIADLKIKKQGSFDRLFGDEERLEDAGLDNGSGLTREDFIYLLK